MTLSLKNVSLSKKFWLQVKPPKPPNGSEVIDRGSKKESSSEEAGQEGGS